MCELGEGVGRIGKDEVIAAGCLTQETQHIGTQDSDIVLSLEGAQELTDEGDVLGIEFHGGDVSTASRQELKRDTARAGKEIQGTGCISLEVDI